MILTINAHREGYAPDQIASTMTVGELIEFLNNFDEDEKVYLSHDNGYTYGGITASRFEEVEKRINPIRAVERPPTTNGVKKLKSAKFAKKQFPKTRCSGSTNTKASASNAPRQRL